MDSSWPPIAGLMLRGPCSSDTIFRVLPGGEEEQGRTGKRKSKKNKEESVVSKMAAGRKCHQHDKSLSRYISCCRERQARQAIYVQRNIEARSRNHCYRGKAISITYSECVSVALGIQHTMRMGHIGICGLSGPTMFFHLILQSARFKKKSY